MQIRKLIDKYNAAVPRYTSYPPANHFREDYSEKNYRTDLERSNHDDPKNISIYIHIPFCRKMCFYCGCNMCTLGKGDRVQPYMKALIQEMEMVFSLLDRNRKISQIHFGGGTPNAIPAEYLEEVNEFIFSHFDLIERPEVAIECNPAYLDHSYMEKLKAAGFNRFSLGIQDFDRKVLDAVHRDPSVLPVQDLLTFLKKDNPGAAVNLDFIYGLPGQTVESFLNTIQKAIEIRPDRLVTFSYAHVPWVHKHQMALEKKGLPQPAEKVNMFLKSREFLNQNGYRSIGMDHYVLEKDELYRAMEETNLHRNFQGYCTRRTTGQVYAFGASAISQMERAYSQNLKNTDEYIKVVSQGKLPVVKGYNPDSSELIIRHALNDLMCNKKLIWDDLAVKINHSPEEIKNELYISDEELSTFASDNIIEYSGEGIRMTEDGMLFIRNVAASLDPLLRKVRNRYSKSV